MKKTFTLIALAAVAMSVNAQKAYEIGKPNNSNYVYLNDYEALKNYVDRSKYPNFKLGIGTTVSEYLKSGSMTQGLTNANFDETVAGNAMKMSSCVSSDGSMNFTTVTNYVNAATKAGLNVYGHTLAWHSQQANGWLRSLIKDKPAPAVNGDVTVWQTLAAKNFTTDKSVGWHSDYTQYNYNITFDSTNGMKVTNTKKINNWEVQYIAMSDIPTEKNVTYKITMTIKGSASGSVTAKLGDWSSGPTANFSFSTQWKDVTMSYKSTVANAFLLLQSGSFVGDIYIKNIKVEKSVKAQTTEEERRCLVVEAGARQSEVYDNQFWILTGSFAKGAKYEFTADIRADQSAKASTQIHTTPGSYVHYVGIGDVNFTTDWRTFKATGTFEAAGSSIAFNLSELAAANNYYFDNVSLKINGVEKVKNGDFEGTGVTSFKSKKVGGSIVDPVISDKISYLYIPGTIPLSQQEKHDTLVWAMEKWIKGMMNACQGKVKAWDVVNEAISGGGNDGSGYYTLQHSEGYNPNGTWDVGGDAFYWQDFMGDLEYVRQAIRLVRKYGPEDIKLFINDYNLESDWDGNKKLLSLINWIKKWEADGVTHVDGIGTQMHISFYKNTTTQNNKKKAITNMFTLMAKTGKLVRVSELDMGYNDINGNNVPTSSMTEAQHKEMADFYEWILKEYFRLIPAAQQWGICHWCPTDAPSNSGWRANTPVGIWDLNYYRKHVYAGFVRGLGGQVYNSIEAPEAPTFDDNARVYNINGVRMNAKFSELPKGIYIVNGKKIAK